MNIDEKNAHVGFVRTEDTNLITTLNKLRDLRQRRDSLALGSAIVDADLSGDNDGVSMADVGNFWATIDAINGLLDADGGGHRTNLYKIALVV